MTARRSPTVIAVAGGSPIAPRRIASLPGAPSGMRVLRISPRRFQLILPTSTYGPPRVITVAVKRHRTRFVSGIDHTTPDRVRAAAETAAQLLWEHYGHPARVLLPVASPVRAVCRRVESDGRVVHRVRVAWPALAGHHVAEIGAGGRITFPAGRPVPEAVREAVEDVAVRLCSGVEVQLQVA